MEIYNGDFIDCRGRLRLRGGRHVNAACVSSDRDPDITDLTRLAALARPVVPESSTSRLRGPDKIYTFKLCFNDIDALHTPPSHSHGSVPTPSSVVCVDTTTAPISSKRRNAVVPGLTR